MQIVSKKLLEILIICVSANKNALKSIFSLLEPFSFAFTKTRIAKASYPNQCSAKLNEYDAAGETNGSSHYLTRNTDHNLGVFEEVNFCTKIGIESSPNTNKSLVLFIYNDERFFKKIQTLISDQYDCLLATSTNDGIELANQHIPSIVISDTLMPNVDGFKVRNILRNNKNTSHIPIIMLLSSLPKDNNTTLSYLNVSWIFKPANHEALIKQIRYIELARQEYQAYLRLEIHKNGCLHDEARISLHYKDKEFTDQLTSIVEDNYENPDFKPAYIAGFFNLTVRAIQLKIKALYDLTPSQYLLIFRLERAKELILQTDLKIGLIAYRVGFNSQQHFTKEFRKHTGLSPRKYRKAIYFDDD